MKENSPKNTQTPQKKTIFKRLSAWQKRQCNAIIKSLSQIPLLQKLLSNPRIQKLSLQFSSTNATPIWIHSHLLFSILFWSPYLFLKPHLLYRAWRTKQGIELTPPRQRTDTWLRRCGIGALFGFLFWLPFWFVCLEFVAPPVGMIGGGIFAALLLLCCIVCLLYCIENNSLKNDLLTQDVCKTDSQMHSHTQAHHKDSQTITLMPTNKNAQYRQYIAFPLFWLIMLLCVGLFSFIHKNSLVGASLSYPISIALFLFMPRQYRFWFGFFVGIFGFYWMTLSFRFEGIGALIPLGIFAVGTIYGIFFYFLLFFENLAWRLCAMLLLFVAYPLDFNWLNLAYLSAYTIFQASIFSVVCLACAWIVLAIRDMPKWIAPCLLLLVLDYKFQVDMPQLQAKMIETHDAQDERWKPEQQGFIIERNLKDIEQAIQEGHTLIILPETSFPFLLNMEEDLYQTLLELSRHITIVVGSLRLQEDFMHYPNAKDGFHFQLDSLPQAQTMTPLESYGNQPSLQSGYYNTIYVFAHGRSLVADKNVLVPFGETLPFSALLDPIFESLFHAQFGFKRGGGILTLETQGFYIALANCYEGTLALPYDTGAEYIVMLSNNAWFAPSTQHIMQQMIAKYYARAYHTFIYHATNYTPKAIITPNNGNH